MVAYESVKTKEKCSWVILKVVAIAYWSAHLQVLFITMFNKRGFTMVVATRAGR